MTHKVLAYHLQNGILANGYLLGGKTEVSALVDLLKKYGEVRVFDGDVGIEEAKRLREEASRGLGGAKERIFFILNADKMSRFVPQAILKTIEDSLAGRHFFIISERPDALPATLSSRLIKLDSDNLNVRNKKGDFGKFIEADFSLRAKIIEDVAESKERFVSFLDDFERFMLDKEKHDFLLNVRLARESAMVFNISRKMCLEYLTHLLV